MKNNKGNEMKIEEKITEYNPPIVRYYVAHRLKTNDLFEKGKLNVCSVQVVARVDRKITEEVNSGNLGVNDIVTEETIYRCIGEPNPLDNKRNFECHFDFKDLPKTPEEAISCHRKLLEEHINNNKKEIENLKEANINIEKELEEVKKLKMPEKPSTESPSTELPSPIPLSSQM